jgi:FAD synthetase
LKVIAFGAFDVLHEGHEHFLCEARALGDYLVVVVARDSTIEKVKGESPWQSESERLARVRALDCVDEAVLGGEGDKHEVLRSIKPEVIALGYDQEANEKALKSFGRVVRLRAFKPKEFKSSIIKKELKKNG